MMLRRRNAKLVFVLGLGALVVAVAVVAAVALADPGQDAGPTEATPLLAERASRAAQALADAHPEDHSVLVLAEVAGRETTRLTGQPSPSAVEALTVFTRRAEDHLVTGARDAGEARRLLSELVRGLRGEPVASPLAQPAPVAAAQLPKAHAVGRDVVVEAGQTVTEASVVGGNLTIRGRVLGDAVAVGGTVTLQPSALVEGDAVAVGGTVRLEPQARVVGDVVSVGGQIQQAQGATVGGDETQVGPAALSRLLPLALPAEGTRHAGSGFVGWLGHVVKVAGVALVMILVGLVVLALMPSRTRTIMLTIRRRPGMSLLAGFLTILIGGAASFLLFITLVGILLVPFVWLAVGLAAALGMTAAAHVIGEVMPGKGRSTRSSLACLGVGVVVMAILSLLPLGGWLLAVVGMVSLGAVIVSKVGAVSPRE